MVGLQKEKKIELQQVKVIWANRKPTIPRPPLLSFFIQEPRKFADKKEEVEGKDKASFPFKARPVPDFSRPSLGQRKPSKPLTVPRPFHLATTERALSPRRVPIQPTPASALPHETKDAAEIIMDTVDDKGDDKFVFHARPMPNFSRNPNSHRKSLNKRASTVSEPFRLHTEARANSPIRSDSRRSLFKGTIPSKRVLTAPKPFRLHTEERASQRSPSPKDSSPSLPVAPPATRRVTRVGGLTAPKPFRLRTMERSNIQSRAAKPPQSEQKGQTTSKISKLPPPPVATRTKKQLTVPKPFQLSSSHLKESVEEVPKPTGKENNVAFSFRARPMPSHKAKITPTVTRKRPLTTPKPFRLRTEERANDEHEDLGKMLEWRSKQTAVARGKQFNETQNVVDQLLVQLSSSLPSVSDKNDSESRDDFNFIKDEDTQIETLKSEDCLSLGDSIQAEV